MTHKRIRKFNTHDTYPEQSLDYDRCQTVVAGNTIYPGGQIGTDFGGNLVGLADPDWLMEIDIIAVLPEAHE